MRWAKNRIKNSEDRKIGLRDRIEIALACGLATTLENNLRYLMAEGYSRAGNRIVDIVKKRYEKNSRI